MRKIKLALPFYAVLSAVLSFNTVYSQYDNSFFDSDKYERDLDSSHIQWHVDNLNYFRNTEYTSLVDKGSTFGGFHILPTMQYQFNDKAVIYGGLFLRYDFGNPQVKQFEPYIKFKYRLWGHDLIFGNLEGPLQHKIIEPTVSYELAITDRTEQGLQIKRENKRIEYDFWIDWKQMIYEDDPFNEVFYGGLNLYFHPIMNDQTKLSLNAQGITQHAAGEIDKSVFPNEFEYNYAFGLEFSQQLGAHSSLFFSGHQTYYYDHSAKQINFMRNGSGLLLVGRLRMHDLDIVATYWNAINYQSPVGDPLYFTIGRRNNLQNPYSLREMISLRFSNEIELSKNLSFLNRLAFIHNLDHSRFDVVMENYLRWHFSGKPKKVNLY